MRDRTDNLTLTQIFERHLMALLHETTVSKSAFAASMRQHYENQFPEAVRDIEFSTHADPNMRMQRDAEKLTSWFSDTATARFPLEMVESFVAAFPAERRRALQVEIMARQGLIAAELPGVGFAASGVTLGKMCQEHGEAVQHVAALMQDGQIDHMDRVAAPRAIQEIDHALAALVSMRRLIRRDALGEDVPMAEVVSLQEVSNG